MVVGRLRFWCWSSINPGVIRRRRLVAGADNWRRVGRWALEQTARKQSTRKCGRSKGMKKRIAKINRDRQGAPTMMMVESGGLRLAFEARAT